MRDNPFFSIIIPTFNQSTFLEKAISKNLPFICANPDFETVENTSNNKIICMGAVAELYKDFGGTVFIMGKPSIDIYNEANYLKALNPNLKNLDNNKLIKFLQTMLFPCQYLSDYMDLNLKI